MRRFFLIVVLCIAWLGLALWLVLLQAQPQAPLFGDSSGARSGGTFANDATVGTVDWDTPSNASASDNVYANAPLTTGNLTSHYLKATNFGFSVPSGATINGITVEVERYGTSAIVPCQDNSIKLVKGGTISGNEKADAGNWNQGSDPNTYFSYGSGSDLWGLTLTDTDVNASTFGVVVSAKCNSTTANPRIDHIRVTVTYTPVNTPQPQIQVRGGTIVNKGGTMIIH